MRALVRQASSRLDEGIVTHLKRQSLDVALAFKQWDAYVEALRDTGWDTIEVPPVEGCPDGVFVEDTMVVFRNVAVIANPGHPSRRGEVQDAEAVVAGLGYSVNRIRAPGTLDGGDVLKIGGTVYVGRGGRTNADGVRQLRRALSP